MLIQRSVSVAIFLFGGRYPGHPYLGGAHRRPMRFPALHLRTPSRRQSRALSRVQSRTRSRNLGLILTCFLLGSTRNLKEFLRRPNPSPCWFDPFPPTRRRNQPIFQVRTSRFGDVPFHLLRHAG